MDKIKRRDVLKGGGAMLVGSLLRNKVEGQTQGQAQIPPKPKADAGNYTTLDCKWITKTHKCSHAD